MVKKMFDETMTVLINSKKVLLNNYGDYEKAIRNLKLRKILTRDKKAIRNTNTILIHQIN